MRLTGPRNNICCSLVGVILPEAGSLERGSTVVTQTETRTNAQTVTNRGNGNGNKKLVSKEKRICVFQEPLRLSVNNNDDSALGR